jgi:putative copper resistance protein D
MLGVKLLLVAAMLSIASGNRYLFVPQLAGHSSMSRLALRIGTLAEIGLGLGVLGLVSVFGMLDPN